MRWEQSVDGARVYQRPVPQVRVFEKTKQPKSGRQSLETKFKDHRKNPGLHGNSLVPLNLNFHHFGVEKRRGLNC